MSYFPEDIPYMSKEELRENGIKIPKDTTDTNIGNTISRQVAIDAFIKRTDLAWENLKIIQPMLCVLEELLSAQSEIIQCKDCKHRGETPIADGRYWCDIHDSFMYYCSDAERRTDG